MKTTQKLDDLWTVAIGILFLLLGTLSTNYIEAQTVDEFEQDTIWLKSGEIIPCVIIDKINSSSALLINYLDESRQLIISEYPFDQISLYKKNSPVLKKPHSFSNPSSSHTKAYLGLGYGWPKMLGISGTFLLSKNMGGSLSYRYRTFNPSNVPENYYTGLFDVFNVPVDEINIFSACFVKAFSSGKTKLIRFSLEAGPAYVNYNRAQFNYVGNSGFIFKSNYDYSHVSEKTIGLTFRGVIAFPLSRIVGFEIAGYGNINSIKSTACIEIYLTIGILRSKLTPKK